MKHCNKRLVLICFRLSLSSSSCSSALQNSFESSIISHCWISFCLRILLLILYRHPVLLASSIHLRLFQVPLPFRCRRKKLSCNHVELVYFIKGYHPIPDQETVLTVICVYIYCALCCCTFAALLLWFFHNSVLLIQIILSVSISVEYDSFWSCSSFVSSSKGMAKAALCAGVCASSFSARCTMRWRIIACCWYQHDDLSCFGMNMLLQFGFVKQRDGESSYHHSLCAGVCALSLSARCTMRERIVVCCWYQHDLSCFGALLIFIQPVVTSSNSTSLFVCFPFNIVGSFLCSVIHKYTLFLPEEPFASKPYND